MVNKNGNTWQASIVVDGITRRVGIGCRGMTRTAAKAKAVLIQAQADAAADLRAKPTLSDCVVLWLGSREWSPRTLVGHTAVTRSLVEHLGNPRGCDVTPVALAHWRNKIVGCEATRCRQSRVVRALFSWLEQAEVIFKNPSKILRASAPVTSPEERYIPADVATLIGATPMNHQQCVALLLYSGLRLGEAHRLEWSDILADRINVRTERKVDGSKQRYRVTRLDPALRDMLKHADRRYPPHGLRYGATTREIQRVVSGVALLINEPLTANACRRWRAVSWHKIYPSHVVCSWLGHTEAVARSHYLKPTEEYYQ